MFLGAERGTKRRGPSRRTPRTRSDDAVVGPWFLYFGDWVDYELDDVDRTLEGASSRLAGEPYRSRYSVNDWIALIYVLAWTMPTKVDYVVNQIAFQNAIPDRHYPRIDADSYRLWEAGRSELPKGRYCCYLSDDIRRCSRSAILALAELQRGDWTDVGRR